MALHRFFLIVILISIFFSNTKVYAQVWVEPELDEVNKLGTPFEKGARKGMGVDIVLSDFGFALGTQYRSLLSTNQEITVSFSLGSLRDVSEQTFTTFFSEIIPNKYNRVISMPLTLGFKQRFLSDVIQDNFRFHIYTAIGTNFAFVYPYFRDFNNNGVREATAEYFEPVLDALSGWGDGSFETGLSSELMLGIDFGNDRKGFSTIRFGLVGHYFGRGIQIMEPGTRKPQKLFLSPQFNLTFGGFW
jgi:hypothetical protein